MEEKNTYQDSDNQNIKSFSFTVELRKRKEKTLIQFSQEELENNQDKILMVLKKECVDLKSWFLIIVSLIKGII